MTAPQRKQRHFATARDRVTKAAPELPKVYGTATLADGCRLTVRLWDRLPPWWNASPESKRMEWLKSFFANQLAGAVPVKVECLIQGIGGLSA